jgi:hypothetical protein
LTEKEWNESHPQQCAAYIKAWKEKEQRESARLASLQHVIAIAGGVKIKGRAPRFEDFFHGGSTRKNPKVSEMKLALQINAMKRKEEKKQNGKK